MKTHFRLFNKNGDLQKVFDHSVTDCQWEFNRQGGCGQASINVPTDDDDLEHVIKPGAFLRIYVDDQLRYTGRLIRPMRTVGPGSENLSLTFYGYNIELSQFVVTSSYVGQGIKTIIEDILDTYVLPYSPITYDSEDIDDPGYSVSEITFNHTVRDAIALLSSLAGSFEWGVDRDRKFYFKRSSKTIRNVYVVGRDITSFSEERKDDEIINRLSVYGGGGLSTIVSSTQSINIFGRREANLFESSLTTQSDLFRLATSFLKNSASFKRSIKFGFLKDDIFVEETLPLGAAAVTNKRISLLPKYGTTYKYGTSIKYGNLKRDQFSNIRYMMKSGGLSIDATLLDDVPNIGELQKRIEFEIRDLQRR